MVGRHVAPSTREARPRRGKRLVTLLVALALVILLVTIGFSNVVTTPPTTSTLGVTTTIAPTTTVPPTVTLSVVGDTELGNTPTLPSSPVSYLAPVKAALAAPIVFGNLEGTLTNATTSKCGAKSTQCYAFRVPPSFANVYRSAGFTVLNAANNHSDDFGSAGVAQTSSALQSAGIAQAGLPGQIGVVRVGSVKVAFCDFAPYVLTNNMLDFAAAARLIAKAKTLANVVVVYMHTGAEGSSADHVTRASEYYVGENRGNPFVFAHAAINDGAALVIASGPHVLRGLEWYRGHLIDYSLGNFVNYEDFSASGTLALSAILHVTLSSTGSFVAGRFTSLVLRSTGQAFVDPSNAAATYVNQLSKQDFGASAATIGANGVIASVG